MKTKTELYEGGSRRSVQPDRRLTSLLLLQLLLLALAFLPVHAATRFWTGAHATSSDWSRNANWDGGAPVNGDTVVFRAGTARLNNNNDIAGLQLAEIRFTDAGYTLGGNGITVSDRIFANNAAGANTINMRITLGANLPFIVAQAGTTLTINSEVRLNGFDLTANTTGILQLNGVVSGTGNLRKIGASSLILGGGAANTFTGDVLLDAGRLVMQKSAGLAVPDRLFVGDGTGGAGADVAINLANDQVANVVVNASGLWDLNGFSALVKNLVLNNGGDVDTGATGNLRLNPGANVTVTANALALTQDPSIISGRLELDLGNHTFTVEEGPTLGTDPTDLQITAEVSGLLAAIIKEGPGDMLLSGNNSFGGNVTVNAGELRLGHSAALGGTVGVTKVNNDAGLRINGGLSIGAEKLILNSTGRSGATGYAALEAIGTSSWTGDIELQQSARIGVASGGTLTLNGTISGTGGMVKENTGTLRLAGNTADNTYAGTTFVNAGTLELDKGTIGGLAAVPGLLVIGDDVGGEHADVVRNLKRNQVSRVTVNGSGFWDLGIFDNEVSDLDLVAGGDVTTAGATGLLRLGINADVTATPGTVVGTKESSISGQLELLFGIHRFTVDNGNATHSDASLRIDAVVFGPGGITKNGRDKLILSGANSFFGEVTVNSGELIAENNLALGALIAGTRVNDSGMLAFFGTGATSGEFLTLDSAGLNPLTAPSALVISGNRVLTGNITLLRDATIHVIGSGDSLECSGVISGAGGMSKIGDGTLLLSGNSPNTYTGVTTVNQGRLQLNKAAQNVSVPGRLVIGDDLGGASADVVECLSVNELGPLSAVTLNSSGQLIARQEEFGSLAGSGSVSVSGSLNPGADNTSTTFSGVISGAGAFNKRGTGTLTLSGNNTYTGGTGIAAGTLLVNGQQPSSALLIQPPGTLGGSGRVGNLSMFAGGATVTPGNSPGRLAAGNVQFTPGSVFRVELDGPVPGTQHDQLKAFGTVDLGLATLRATLNFTPVSGQPLVIIDNDGTDAVIGQFNGLAEGDALRVDQIPFVVSYVGGDGNDVTLTPTIRAVSFVSTRIEAGNGNGLIDPNECNHLFVELRNETASPLTLSHVVLDSFTPGVVATQPRSDYATIPAGGTRMNQVPFQFRVAPDFVCGQPVEFALPLTVGTASITIPFTVPSGSSGTPPCIDGGGVCESCVPALIGRFSADPPSTTSRLVRNGITSGCGSAKVCPAVTAGPALFYRVHLITNSGPATCVSVVLKDLCRASNLRLHAAAYLGTYDAANPCANYLGDTGRELIGDSMSFAFAAPQDAVIALVVSSPVAATTCPVNYSLQVFGLPCPPPTLHIAKTANLDEVRLYWSTAYPDYDLQRVPNLNGAAPYPFANVPFTPFVVNGDYSVTNKTTAPQSYFRLRKP